MKQVKNHLIKYSWIFCKI